MTQALASAPDFGAWASLYQRFRPGYPAEVFDRMSALVGGRDGLCIELGAGSGHATLDLAARFKRVVAVEPDTEMAALIPSAPHVEVMVANAETVEFSPGCADVVVAATAFHWMDQAAVAGRAASWLRPGGVFFAFVTGKVQYPEAPRAVTEILHAEMTRARKHMDGRISSWRPYEDAIRGSGAFTETSAFEIYADFEWTPAEAAGFMATTSFGQALARSTGDADAYLARLSAELAIAARGRLIHARIPIEGAYGRVGPTTS